MNNRTERHPLMPPQVFAKLGGNQIAYVRPVASEDLPRMFPDAPALACWPPMAARS